MTIVARGPSWAALHKASQYAAQAVSSGCSRALGSVQVVPEYVAPLDEDAVQMAAFELLFAFDEVISLGYKEHVTVQQARHAHLPMSVCWYSEHAVPSAKVPINKRLCCAGRCGVRLVARDCLPSFVLILLPACDIIQAFSLLPACDVIQAFS